MSRQELDDLTAFRLERFDHREKTALTLVRQFLIYEGDFPDPALVDDFKRLFSPREQTAVLAVMKMMAFFNLLVNTFNRRTYAEGTSCTFTPKSDDDF